MATVKADTLLPFLKWAGGKRWLLPYLIPVWKQHAERRLVEPFSGGLAVALGLQPRAALLNDCNPHLINLYRQVQRGLDPHCVDMRYDKAHYYACRDRFNSLIAAGRSSTAEAAALFYLLNRTGFNGLCRFNRSGFFNIPVGKYKAVTFAKDFEAYKRQFALWEFSNQDFAALLINSESDYLYLDPPYDGTFNDYSPGGFDWTDQVRLVEWAAQWDCPVLISNAATKRITKLYRDHGFRLRYLDAPRTISCDGRRDKVREVLATRNVRGVPRRK